MPTFNRVTDKRIHLNLLGVAGNIFAVFGAFQRQARCEGWTDEDISAVLNQAKSTEYDYSLYTIKQYCVNEGAGPDEAEGADMAEYDDGTQYA